MLTVEVPHLVRLVAENQFDTIYHEHFCYFSLVAAERVFAKHGLVLFDVEELPTHGGSLRYFARPAADESKPVEPRVAALGNASGRWAWSRSSTTGASRGRWRKRSASC